MPLQIASISAFVMMLFYVFRKSMPALISGIVYVTMGSILYTFPNLLLKAVFQSEKIDCTKFTNLGNMLTHVNASADTETYVRASIVAVVILAISMAITCLSLNKKDIKGVQNYQLQHYEAFDLEYIPQYATAAGGN